MDQPQSSIRTQHRFSVSYPVIFGGAPFVGEGELCDLSTTGCSIKGNRTVLLGSYVRLNVVLPHPYPSLFVELGRIRWVQKHLFGIEFIRLPTIGQQRLDGLVWERLTSRLLSI
jgi:hypothetical protein